MCKFLQVCFVFLILTPALSRAMISPENEMKRMFRDDPTIQAETQRLVGLGFISEDIVFTLINFRIDTSMTAGGHAAREIQTFLVTQQFRAGQGILSLERPILSAYLSIDNY